MKSVAMRPAPFSFCFVSVFFNMLISWSVSGSIISITRQDVGITSGSLPAYQYDSAGNFIGTIGPQGDTNFIQDIAIDPLTGDLWALIADPNNSSATTIANLTQNTSFAAGQSVFVDRGANIAVYNGFATITRQDLGVISGSLPAYQYDSAGNFIGTIGPQRDTNFIQDIANDPLTGDLWALIADPNNSSATTIANLTQNTSFAAGQSVFVDRGANIAVYNGFATITRQDLGVISGSLPAYQYDSAGNFIGTIGPQRDTNFIQDIANDPLTGDLWALIADPNNSSATTIANLTQNTSFAAGQSVFVDRGANITYKSSSGGPAPVPEPTGVIIWSMLALFSQTVISQRSRRRQSNAYRVTSGWWERSPSATVA